MMKQRIRQSNLRSLGLAFIFTPPIFHGALSAPLFTCDPQKWGDSRISTKKMRNAHLCGDPRELEVDVYAFIFSYISLTHFTLRCGNIPFRTGGDHSPPIQKVQRGLRNDRIKLHLCRERLFPNLPLHRQKEGMKQIIRSAAMGTYGGCYGYRLTSERRAGNPHRRTDALKGSPMA